MIFKIFLSPYQVVNPVELHPLLRLVWYRLSDPGRTHRFTQPVTAGSLTWFDW